ncbi:TPA: hypothetical protein DDW69_02145 [candidate division CPR2 bacterium]|uniref:Thioredoxin reductase, thioredoxin reductase (NADPH) n=1 Tax=candidate division CPR2 bacterium GW2011_GWC1_41_48 TaxID=1618344 RepID=A0A0G0WCP0_UNCC2|nr:MAG: Thioredoxin reductase [candidate division CPR2 bacterium GW2011_GWC2_39_35]KKR28115.1 MAG: Thioredoxin reductase [candidate division CPR2 bacterium GW2011_GWD2_39_7]KKR29560.1 MAG: Thioredoxin reductase [candidate division CPR2 bacterium GW2011_GWD1_39_7]KKS09827.1 MAG: thioredoxin reductase, thioredoxin reductase (NADPH) [candidate division CPR2 bacterium GW2011_GWC1_41_48]OGB55866.1 MAG: hypothetical protein A2Y27_00390 [candidate division CPR2 bacterium GWD1_39_7]OGB72238.1 MAG: hyp
MLDLAIIGTGPAGLSAAIYAARYLINFKIYGQIPGGQINEAHLVDNYPGIPGVTGEELVTRFNEHLKHLEVKTENILIKGIKKENGIFNIILDSSDLEKASVEAKNILLTIGTERIKLAIPGEAEFMGKGVSYCATCDAFFYRHKSVAVVGGSDSALTSALYLADVAKEVYLIYRGKDLKAMPVWIEKAKANSKIKIVLERNITKVSGTNFVEEIELDKEFDGEKNLKVDGVFVEIGTTPNVALIKSLEIKTDDRGFIETDTAQKTNVPGVWAAGDITTGSNKFRQIVTAASEGAVAVHDIYKNLKAAEKETGKLG